jgi:hypothetical protein
MLGVAGGPERAAFPEEPYELAGCRASALLVEAGRDEGGGDDAKYRCDRAPAAARAASADAAVLI